MKQLLATLFIVSVGCSGMMLAGDQGNGGCGAAAFGLEVIAYANCPAGDFIGSNRRMIAVKADFTDGRCEDADGNVLCEECCVSDDDCAPGESCIAGPSDKVAQTITHENDILLADSGCTDGEGCPGDPTVFNVYDGNACDDREGAKLFLPTYVSRDYLVGVRMVGQPGGKIGVTTCATELGTGDCCEAGEDCGGVLEGFCLNDDTVACAEDSECDTVTCSEKTLVRVRESGRNGRPRYTNATDELLFICLTEACNGQDRIPLFDPDYEDFFWNWNTQGRPHAQLRFWEKDDCELDEYQ